MSTLDGLWPRTREYMESLGFVHESDVMHWGPKQTYRRGGLQLSLHYNKRDVGYDIVARYEGEAEINLQMAAWALGAEREVLDKIFWQRIDDDLVTQQLVEYVLKYVGDKLNTPVGCTELIRLEAAKRAWYRASLQQ